MFVITSLFNPSPDLEEMLRVCLYSVRRNTASQTFVYHSGVSDTTIKSLKDEGHIVIPMRFNFDEEKECPSQKMYLWNSAINDPRMYNRDLVLMDCDMLVTEDLSEVFSKPFDFAYTAKEDPSEQFPFNSGIVFLRNRDITIRFMERWLKETEKVLTNPDLLDYAIALLGGADQMALARAIGRTTHLLSSYEYYRLKLMGLPCSTYNLHKYWDDPSRSKVIHFKSGWSQILVQDTDNFKEAVLKGPWGKRKNILDIIGSWEPSYNLWKQYQKEYRGI